jgi:osmotically-inducible protein OsmY
MRHSGRVLGVAFVIAAAFASVRLGAADTSDALLTTKTQIALLTSPDLHGAGIEVETVGGVVTLRGYVRTSEEQRSAEAVARDVDGVREVRDLLVVTSGAGPEAVAVPDPELRHEVARALQHDAMLDDGDTAVAVVSVRNGVVTLAGRTPTLSDVLHALRIVVSVPGVDHVCSEIQSLERIATADDDGGRVRVEEPAAGGSVEDMLITSAAKLRLLADSRTPSLGIVVHTRRGVVTLFGIVPSRDARRAAEEDARKVSGVMGLRNALEIVPDDHRDTVDADDEQLEKTVKRTLDTREDLRDLGIGIEVRNGVVRLSGVVPTRAQRTVATTTAQSTDGVRSVLDDLRVGGTTPD